MKKFNATGLSVFEAIQFAAVDIANVFDHSDCEYEFFTTPIKFWRLIEEISRYYKDFFDTPKLLEKVLFGENKCIQIKTALGVIKCYNSPDCLENTGRLSCDKAESAPTIELYNLGA